MANADQALSAIPRGNSAGVVQAITITQQGYVVYVYPIKPLLTECREGSQAQLCQSLIETWIVQPVMLATRDASTGL